MALISQNKEISMKTESESREYELNPRVFLPKTPQTQNSAFNQRFADHQIQNGIVKVIDDKDNLLAGLPVLNQEEFKLVRFQETSCFPPSSHQQNTQKRKTNLHCKIRVTLSKLYCDASQNSKVNQ